MKKLLIAGICLLGYYGTAMAQTVSPPPPPVPKDPFAGKVKFDEQKVSFGTTKFNQPVTVFFPFTNIGSQPLIVENVQASCGCTNPTWPKHPILPGQTDSISATYSANMMGMVNKTVWVRFAGINDDMTLQVLGKVVN